MRLLTWCHISGLHNPIIPRGLISASHQFIFTSPCSLEADEVVSLPSAVRERCGVVCSSGGFRGLPEPGRQVDRSIAVGYLGSLNFAKLHPDFVEYLAAVATPDFKVRMIGDTRNRDILERQSAARGKADMLEFRGYATDVASELAALNVLAYLLNPEHYGTTENALLEAMATGIVPVVLDNAAECQIVEDRGTGLVVRSPAEFAEAIRWLVDNPGHRHQLGLQAARSVRERFSVEKTEASLRSHYWDVLTGEKSQVVFEGVFGSGPAEWFLSCQRDKDVFGEDGSIHLVGGIAASHGLLEETKGTVFHFSEHFPADARLRSWAENLRLLQ
jgi:glycosyltransferase involved in cell wall biosynthesis